MARIIDALLITLGMDVRGYREGSRQATRELDRTRRAVGQASQDMSKAVTGAAKSFALAFLGFSSASGFVKMLVGLNEGARQLLLMGKNTGQAAAQLRNYANAAELAGGSAEGLLGTIQQIQKEQTNLLVTGDSGWLGYLRQLRVDLTGVDQAGKPVARDQIEVLTDLAAAFERIAKTEGRPRANSLGLMMGIDQGSMNFLLEGPKRIAELVEKQKQLPQLNDKTAESAARLAYQWNLLKQRGAALGLVLLEQLQPHLESIFALFERWSSSKVMSGDAVKGITTAMSALGKVLRFVYDLTRLVIKGWQDIFKLAGMAWDAMPEPLKKFGSAMFGNVASVPGLVKDLADGKTLGQALEANPINPIAPWKNLASETASAAGSGIVGWLRSVANGGSKYADRLRNAEEKYGIPRNLLYNIAKRESNFDPNARSKAGAVGLMQLMPQYFPNAGKDASADIDTAGKYLAQLYRQFGSWEEAVAAYNAGPGTLRKVQAGKRTLPTETRNYVGALFPNPGALATVQGLGSPVAGRGGAGAGGSVSIGNLYVNAPNATNAEGIAAAMREAIERKMIVGQANYGLQ